MYDVPSLSPENLKKLAKLLPESAQLVEVLAIVSEEIGIAAEAARLDAGVGSLLPKRRKAKAAKPARAVRGQDKKPRKPRATKAGNGDLLDRAADGTVA